jgi:hypothetical protein
LSASAIRTPERVCVSVAVPTSLPSADLSSAVAESGGVAADFLAAAPSLAPCAILRGAASASGVPVARTEGARESSDRGVSFAAADAATSSTADAAMNRYMIATSVFGEKSCPQDSKLACGQKTGSRL